MSARTHPETLAVEAARCANAVRFLAADAVDKAKSGHPGAPLGMAEIAEVVWRRHLRHNPANPSWPDRDRFVLSNGHGSMLLYALLHLTGYGLTADELARFRQLHSQTPGHPERGVTPGVETTTGPLGQGLANAVGMAIAEKLLASQFNRPGFDIVDHRTYAFVGDGCLMEGISHEACSLAGALGLGKLIVVYDDNGISIDGDVSGWFRDDTAKRFEAYGWRVIRDIDGHDAAAVDAALVAARRRNDKPTLIMCRTTIGQGAPTKAGTHDVHGAPLGATEIDAMRDALAWPHAPFEIPPEVAAAWDARPRGVLLERQWRATFYAYACEHPALAAEFERRVAGRLPETFESTATSLCDSALGVTAAKATRKASQDALATLVAAVPELLGGSADLTGSNLTAVTASAPVNGNGWGNYIHYGVREFGMAAAMNGVALHGGFIPYGGTFLVFSDYARNAIRMSALMRQRVVYVLTHDSIGLGEDGPTHQPIEHAASLRMIPNVDVWRPCDSVETSVAWAVALQRSHGPTCLLLSRQNVRPIERAAGDIESIRCGGYVLRDAGGSPDAALIATGSEVEIALDAQRILAGEGIDVRVVSMPCTSVFDRMPRAYRDAVLPPLVPCVAIEAGVTSFWRAYIGRDGLAFGIDRFGESAPARELYAHFGLEAKSIAAAISEWLNARARADGNRQSPVVAAVAA
jgi:transketolase